MPGGKEARLGFEGMYVTVRGTVERVRGDCHVLGRTQRVTAGTRLPREMESAFATVILGRQPRTPEGINPTAYDICSQSGVFL